MLGLKRSRRSLMLCRDFRIFRSSSIRTDETVPWGPCVSAVVPSPDTLTSNPSSKLHLSIGFPAHCNKLLHAAIGGTTVTASIERCHDQHVTFSTSFFCRLDFCHICEKGPMTHLCYVEVICYCRVWESEKKFIIESRFQQSNQEFPCSLKIIWQYPLFPKNKCYCSHVRVKDRVENLLINTRNLRNLRKLLRYKDIWTIKACAGLESKLK